MKLENLKEATDISVYSKLLIVLGEYSDKCPMTGISKLLTLALDNGKSILPKDKRALDILKHVLNKNPLEAVQKLLNCKFSNLPADLKPRFREGSDLSIAFWNNGVSVSDTVISLINFDKSSKKSGWCSLDGTSVTLI